MAETFYIRIGRIADRRVVLHCLTGFSGAADDFATSRSFALMVLQDAKLHAEDATFVAPRRHDHLYLQHATIGIRAAEAAAPLADEIDEAEVWEESWHQANIARFVVSTKVLARRNVFPYDELVAIRSEIVELGETWKLVEAGWQRLHNYDLEVEVTDAKYLAHLIEGHLFGTAAFDAWVEAP